MPLSDVKTFRIYPGIGVARVGDSPEAYFIGPEVPGAGPPKGTHFKDSQERIARQGARFRIFGYNGKGDVVDELTSLMPGVQIEWSVALANRKASNIKFNGVRHGMEMDKKPDPKQLRNLDVQDRTKLDITPSPKSIQESQNTVISTASPTVNSLTRRSILANSIRTMLDASLCSGAVASRAAFPAHDRSTPMPTMTAGMTMSPMARSPHACRLGGPRIRWKPGRG
jgi:L-Lysine epsilon oxidase N-terminal